MELLILFAVLIPCGLVAGSVYAGKGRSYLAGLTVGILFGPLGLLFAYFSGPNYDEVRHCPTCKTLIPVRSRRCHACRTALDVLD